jgi:hypothetical protein
MQHAQNPALQDHILSKQLLMAIQQPSDRTIVFATTSVSQVTPTHNIYTPTHIDPSCLHPAQPTDPAFQIPGFESHNSNDGRPL